MKSEIISFRPGHELMSIIMSDCKRREISATEWILQVVHSQLRDDETKFHIKDALEEIRDTMLKEEEINSALEKINQLIEAFQ